MPAPIRSFLRRHHIPARWIVDPVPPPDATDVFCHPVPGDPLASTLLETPHFRVVPSRMPLARGHVLIIPKQHVQVYGDIPTSWQQELNDLTVTFRRFQKEMYGYDSFAREQGSPLGSRGNRQSIRHAHFHLIPYPGSIQDVPAITGALRLESFRDLIRYRLTQGFYHYIEVNNQRFVMPDDGPGVAEAERFLRDQIGNVWDPVKLQPTKFEGEEGKAMYSEACDKWNTWVANGGLEQSPAYRLKGVKVHKEVAFIS